MRYCVLGIPRTGSTWLINGIGHCFSRLKNYVNLHEFFTPFADSHHYTIDDNKMICHQKEITDDIEIDDVNEFNKSRMDFLLKGNIKQPLMVKYMYWPYEGYINSKSLLSISTVNWGISSNLPLDVLYQLPLPLSYL